MDNATWLLLILLITGQGATCQPVRQDRYGIEWLDSAEYRLLGFNTAVFDTMSCSVQSEQASLFLKCALGVKAAVHVSPLDAKVEFVRNGGDVIWVINYNDDFALMGEMSCLYNLLNRNRKHDFVEGLEYDTLGTVDGFSLEWIGSTTDPDVSIGVKFHRIPIIPLWQGSDPLERYTWSLVLAVSQQQ